MLITKLNESYLKITDIEYDTAIFLNDQFSFFAEGYRWNPKFKTKKWDGKIRLFNMRNSTLPIGCFDKLINLCNNSGIKYKVADYELIDVDVTTDKINNFIQNDIKCELILRDYQINAVLGSFNKNKCITLLPTSSGKSFIQFTIINYLLQKGYIKKALLIVPTVSLVDQMQYDFLDYAKNVKDYKENIHCIYSGKSKESDKSIIISTWQSLINIEDKNWFKQFDLIASDEVHLATGKCLSDIISLCSNAKFKLGFSGTLQESKVAKEQLESLFGSVNQFVTTQELMEAGTLTKIKIYNLVLNYSEEDKKKFKDKIKTEYKKERDGAAKKYQIESDFIKKNKNRVKFILQTIKKCKGNTLILFKNIDYGEKLAELINKYIEDRNVYFICGDISPAERERVRLIMEEENDAIIVATLNIFSTGINIKKLKYLMFVQSVKSKIKVLQSIGRVLRKHGSKNEAIFIDIIDSIDKKNFSVKHGLSKLELYETEGFDYKVKEINLG